jgi:uncharacterized protein YcbX
MERFRANLVLDGLQAYDEDLLDEITLDAEGGPVRAEAGEALRALQHPERRPGHRRDRPRAR